MRTRNENEKKTTVRKQIGETIRAVRKSKGMTQVVVARAIGVSQSNFSKFEAGILEPSASQWFAFCQVTKTSYTAWMTAR
jgi:transcriptional regulator with XRE-family HTH domain